MSSMFATNCGISCRFLGGWPVRLGGELRVTNYELPITRDGLRVALSGFFFLQAIRLDTIVLR